MNDVRVKVIFGLAMLMSGAFSDATGTQWLLHGPVPDPDLSSVYAGVASDHQIGEQGPHIHDASRVVEIDGWRMLAATGKENCCDYGCGIETWFIPPGGEDWQPGQCLLTEKPEWIRSQIPNNDGSYWAPAFATPRRIYYSVDNLCDFENCVEYTAIGMLHGSGSPPAMNWQDPGTAVTRSIFDAATRSPSSIDPSYFEDDDGTRYLIYGGGFIYAARLDSRSGLIDGPVDWQPEHPAYTFLAAAPPVDDEPAWIEAPYMVRNGDHYYLFVNWGDCCAGINSTYEMRVGRSTAPTGPFLDRSGIDMRQGGGTLFLDSQGMILGNPALIGPGHAGVYREADGGLRLTFHYYNGEDDGIPWLGSATVEFVDGWPQIVTGSVEY